MLPTEPNGYSIRLRPDQLDLSEFHALARRGEEHLAARRHADARTAFDRALSLWRGRPVADLPVTALADYTARLVEQRFTVLRQRIGIDLCEGRGPAVVAELTGLCARHPTREDLHQQLMIALVRAGRTAEALHAYADARRTMLAEAGVEPGPALRATQEAILRGTPVWDTARHLCRGRPAR